MHGAPWVNSFFHTGEVGGLAGVGVGGVWVVFGVKGLGDMQADGSVGGCCARGLGCIWCMVGGVRSKRTIIMMIRGGSEYWGWSLLGSESLRMRWQL